jgi:hypothetical protein
LSKVPYLTHYCTFLSAFGMMLKIWTKVPDFLSKSVLKSVQVQKSARDEIGICIGIRTGGMHWEKLQRGAIAGRSAPFV